jgi:predicted MFS family arabinose efflux permease
MAAELIGVAALGVPGGKVLERLGARRTMLVADGIRAPLMMLIPVLHWTGGLSFGVLLAVAFALGGLAAPYIAAQKVIVPELLGEDEALVSEASALFQGAQRVTMLMGPVLAGVLIGFIGATNVLVVDAATYVVAFVLIRGFVPARKPAPSEGEDTSLRAGLRFIFRDPLLRVWSPAFVIGDTAWTAFFAAIPVIVVDRYGSDAKVAGWLLAGFGIGAVAGNVIAYKFLLRRLDGLALIGRIVLGQALPLWLLTLSLPAWAMCLVLVTSGLANGLVNPSIHAWGPQPVLVALASIQSVTMAVVALVSLRVRTSEGVLVSPEPA